jgi:hypothetical protein
MASLRTGRIITSPIGTVRNTALASAGLLWSSAAWASQGPGGGPGTADHFTQLAMAIVVYGTCALVVLAGLIGGARRRCH